jgi:long-chain fatty acid transport protein
MRRLPLLAALALAALLAPGPASAGGFMIYEHSALGTGMADARTALWDDPSSMFYNPSAITELDGFHLSLGDTLLLPDNTYTPDCPTGVTCRSATGDFHVFYPPHIYFTAEATTWLHVGIGYNNPFGMGSYWPADWDGKFTAYQTYIETHFIQPVLAFDIAELVGMDDDYALSFAVGGYYVYGKAKLASKVDATDAWNAYHDPADPLPVAQMAMEGDGHGGGFNFSLFAAYKPWVSFGASVRSNVTMDFSGTATFTAPTAAWADIMRGIGFLPASTPGTTTIELPWNMNFGLAFHGVPQFTFAVDAYVTLWQSYDQLQVHFDCEHSAAPNSCDPGLNAAAIYPKKWNTGVQLSFGAEYRPIPDLAIRAGYGYVSDPTNPVYYDAQLPDGNRHLICFGIGYRAPALFKVDIGYMLALWSGTKDNAVGSTSPLFQNGLANGTYDTMVHILALSLGFSFDLDGMAPPPTLDPPVALLAP